MRSNGPSENDGERKSVQKKRGVGSGLRLGLRLGVRDFFAATMAAGSASTPNRMHSGICVCASSRNAPAPQAGSRTRRRVPETTPGGRESLASEDLSDGDATLAKDSRPRTASDRATIQRTTSGGV